MDEPTSQLDPLAEAELYRQFAGIVQGKTALFVTHRLGSTRITDRILEPEQGRIVEEGSHAVLMARPQGQLPRLIHQKEARELRAQSSHSPAVPQEPATAGACLRDGEGPDPGLCGPGKL